MNIGRTSYFLIGDTLTAAETAEVARRAEASGYDALWVSEALGREIFSHAAYLLANTTKLVVAAGIANIYARDANAMAAGQLTLNEQSGGRFLLGIGVSHAPLVEGLRGHVYGKPVATMQAYLDAMKKLTYVAPQPAEKPKTILAALRPRMLELAAKQADGAITVFVPPEHTAKARTILGTGKQLVVAQYAILEKDLHKARAAAGAFVAQVGALPSYRENLKSLGFTDKDFDNGCSDRLVEAAFVWGDEAAINKRIDAHFAAGADHVTLLPLNAQTNQMVDLRVLDTFAPKRA